MWRNDVFPRNQALAPDQPFAGRSGLDGRQARARRPVAGGEGASQSGRTARHAALAVLGLFVLLAQPVTRAQASAFTPEAHCADVASLVSRAGGAILETAPETFHRVVRDNSFCDPDGVARPAFAPTQDNPACFVGYKCSDYPVR
ncbi:MAG: hypothetical protein B7Y65_04870 [Azorhizobium sp. 35-67-15]|nr:MAG: hypothetical protein B7Y65_04870 [Azorhizobium sp. 35-67-15]